MAHSTSVPTDSYAFIISFIEGTLSNKKKQHGNYRILQGPFCKLLVRSRTISKKPNGCEAVAIDLSTQNKRFVFFFERVSHNKAWNAINRLGCQNIPYEFCTSDTPNILNSGIIDHSSTHVLVELGDTPFLCKFKMNSDGSPSLNSLGREVVDTMEQLDTRVATLAEAITQTAILETQRILLDTFIIEEMPNSFVPPSLDNNILAVLHHPINPLNFGFTVDQCKMWEGRLVLKDMDSHARAPTSHYIAYTNAIKSWDVACEQFKIMYPERLGELVTNQYSRYSSGGIGVIVISPIGTFLRGQFYRGYSTTVSNAITTWHKLIRTKTIKNMVIPY